MQPDRLFRRPDLERPISTEVGTSVTGESTPVPSLPSISWTTLSSTIDRTCFPLSSRCLLICAPMSIKNVPLCEYCKKVWPIDEYWLISYQLSMSIPLRKLIANFIISHPKTQTHYLPSLRLRAHHPMLYTVVNHLNILQQLISTDLYDLGLRRIDEICKGLNGKIQRNHEGKLKPTCPLPPIPALPTQGLPFASLAATFFNNGIHKSNARSSPPGHILGPLLAA